MAYTYRGKPSKRVVPLKPCGTVAAYKRHLYRKEIACDACLKAQRDYAREYDRRTNKRSRPKIAPCGTVSGYARHQRNGEPIDHPCRDARNAWMRAYNARKKESNA